MGGYNFGCGVWFYKTPKISLINNIIVSWAFFGFWAPLLSLNVVLMSINNVSNKKSNEQNLKKLVLESSVTRPQKD